MPLASPSRLALTQERQQFFGNLSAHRHLFRSPMSFLLKEQAALRRVLRALSNQRVPRYILVTITPNTVQIFLHTLDSQF